VGSSRVGCVGPRPGTEIKRTGSDLQSSSSVFSTADRAAITECLPSAVEVIRVVIRWSVKVGVAVTARLFVDDPRMGKSSCWTLDS